MRHHYFVGVVGINYENMDLTSIWRSNYTGCCSWLGTPSALCKTQTLLMAESLGCTPLMRKVRILKGLKDSQYLNMADTRLIVVSLDFIECTELRNTSVDEKFTSHTYSTQHSPTVLPRMTRTEGRKDAKMAVVRLPS